MKTIIGLVLSLATALIIGSTAMAQNENKVSFSNYVVYYNVFPSDVLEPKISKAVGLRRSASQGVITVVVKKINGNTSVATKADIHGTATNLIGQVRQIKMIEVKDGKAVYYLGQFTVARDENLRFNVNVLPAGDTVREKFTFSHQF